jgi:predicted nucleic acid-binding Zn ribbon protein
VTDFVATLLWVASDLDRRSYPFAGAIRQGACRISELEAIAPAPDACERCGAPIDRKPRGRPRRFCSERCRRRKTVGNATLRRSSLQAKENHGD